MRPLFLLLALGLAAPLHAQTQGPSRGELLYANHCVECHTKQVHWRDKRMAKDWTSLRQWVRHWESEGRLQWSGDEIEAVARYLNDTIYRFAQPIAER